MYRKLLTAAIALVAIFTLYGGQAQADATWALTIATPKPTQNTRTVQVQYTVLSLDARNFTVKLYQQGNPTALGSQDTSGDPNAINGNSGTFAVTAPTDGTFSYYVAANPNDNPGDVEQTAAVTVSIDTTQPATPIYGGKTQNGNTYTVSVTAPAGSDITSIEIYASTSTSFSTNTTTRVGTVAINAGETKTFTYVAPDNQQRYFAARGFDANGNGSTVVGDSNTVVSSGTSGATTASATNGSASGDAANSAANGNVQAPGNNQTDAAKDVLGTAAKATDTNGQNWPLIIVLSAVALAVCYYLFVKNDKSSLFRKQK